MSKKLIAVAAAAALALTGLVGIAPANASVVVTFGVNDAAGTGITAFTPSETAAAAAANIVVPADNKLTFTNSADRSSLAKVTVTTTTGETVTASSTGAMKIIDVDQIGSDFRAETTAGTDYTSASGSQAFSKVATTTSVVFYVFTTSTSAASLTVNKGGNTRIVWIKGAAGSAYNLTSTMPSLIPAAAPSTANLIVKVTDVFGNEVKASTGFTTSATGGGAVITATGAQSHSSTLGGYGLSLHATGTGGLAVSVSFTDAITDVTGLAKPVKIFFAQSTAVDLAGLNTQVTALTAQVAALTAQLANSRAKDVSVTKAKYNSLARKWNASNPSARVALKK